jgi:hypothetical protein
LQRKVKILWRPSWSKKIEDRVGLDMKMFFLLNIWPTRLV